MKNFIIAFVFMFGVSAHAMRNNNPVLLNALDATISENSAFVDAAFITSGSLQGILTGTTVSGTLYLQASNDNQINLLAGTIARNWNYVSGGTVFLSRSSSTQGTVAAMIPFQNLNYRWLRAVWAPQTTGTLSTITSTGFFVGF